MKYYQCLLSRLLLICIFPSIGNAEELHIRFEFEGENVPKHMKLASAANIFTQIGDEVSDERVGSIYMSLNMKQNSNGVWFLPETQELKFDMAYAQTILDLLQSLKDDAEHRISRVQEVVACPTDRNRPRGDDVYVALKVLVDAKYGIWEALRQEVARGPHAEAIENLFGWSGSIHSRSYYHKDMYERTGRDPDLMLEQFCTGLAYRE